MVSQPCQEGSAPSCTLLVPRKRQCPQPRQGQLWGAAARGHRGLLGRPVEAPTSLTVNLSHVLLLHRQLRKGRVTKVQYFGQSLVGCLFFRKVEFLLLPVSVATVTVMQRL